MTSWFLRWTNSPFGKDVNSKKERICSQEGGDGRGKFVPFIADSSYGVVSIGCVSIILIVIIIIIIITIIVVVAVIVAFRSNFVLLFCLAAAYVV